MTKKPETRIKVLNTERYQLYCAQYKSTHLFGLIGIWVDIRPTWRDSVFVATLEKAKERIDDFLRKLEMGGTRAEARYCEVYQVPGGYVTYLRIALALCMILGFLAVGVFYQERCGNTVNCSPDVNVVQDEDCE